MWLIDKLRGMGWFTLLLVTIYCGGCATNKVNEAPKDDLTDLHIDPDQPALPPNSAGNGNESLDTKESKKTTVVGGAVIPPTPTVDELERGEAAEAGEPSVVPEPPMNTESALDAQVSDEIGSGPQVRYVKAAQLYIRSEPNRFSQILGMLKGGQRVKVKIQGGWARLDKGQWIRARWLVKKKPSGFYVNEDSKEPLRSKKAKKRSDRKQKASSKKRTK